MKEGTTVARELVERLWKDLRGTQPPNVEPAFATLPPSDHIVHRPDLAYLNRHWVWDKKPDAASRRGSPFRVRRWLKARLARLVMDSMDAYLVEERAFIERLVRFQNEAAKKSDQLSDEVRQVAAADRALAAWMQERIDDLSRHNGLLHGLLEARVERLEASKAEERGSPR
jgi:hypothetical protein